MSVLPPQVKAALEEMIQHIYSEVLDRIRAEIPRMFGQAWRNGKIDGSFGVTLASTTLTGVVKVDGTTISVAPDGTLSTGPGGLLPAPHIRGDIIYHDGTNYQTLHILPAADVSSFVTEWTGQVISNGGTQCVALVNQFMDEVLMTPNTAAWTPPVVDAYQIYSYAPSPPWTIIPNLLISYPLPGDIVVWSSALPGSGGAGHTSLCVTATALSLLTFDQNWAGVPTAQEVLHTDYTDVVGWIRFTG